MAFDLKKFLKDELGVADDQLDTVAAAYTPTMIAGLEKSVLRQSDYSRHMNDLSAEKAALKEANEALNAELAEWAAVQASGGKITTQMKADLDAARAEKLRVEQSIQSYATANGIDVTKILGGTVSAPTTTPTVDLTGYVKAEDVERIARQQAGIVANMAIEMPVVLAEIAYEHQELTGTRLDTRAIAQEIRNRAADPRNTKSLDPRAIWEETHKVGDLRRDAEQKRIDTLIAEAKKSGREEALTEGSIPGSHTPGHRASPVFAKPHESVLKRPQPQSTTNAAAAAFRSGKYRSANVPAGGGR
jgi:hypothetical protein